jgi:hypothetical protein
MMMMFVGHRCYAHTTWFSVMACTGLVVACVDSCSTEYMHTTKHHVNSYSPMQRGNMNSCVFLMHLVRGLVFSYQVA